MSEFAPVIVIVLLLIVNVSAILIRRSDQRVIKQWKANAYASQKQVDDLLATCQEWERADQQNRETIKMYEEKEISREQRDFAAPTMQP